MKVKGREERSLVLPAFIMLDVASSWIHGVNDNKGSTIAALGLFYGTCRLYIYI